MGSIKPPVSSCSPVSPDGFVCLIKKECRAPQLSSLALQMTPREGQGMDMVGLWQGLTWRWWQARGQCWHRVLTSVIAGVIAACHVRRRATAVWGSLEVLDPGAHGSCCCQLCQASQGCQSLLWSRGDGTCWTPPPGTLQGGLSRAWGRWSGAGVFTLTAVTRPGAAGNYCPQGQGWERARVCESGCEKETRAAGRPGARGCVLGGECPQREAMGGCRGGGLSERMP